jgi:ATP-dependent Clp protease ATP-binding subunit ClpA
MQSETADEKQGPRSILMLYHGTFAAPDEAYRIMDQAGARARIRRDATADNEKSRNRRIRLEKAAIKAQDFEKLPRSRPGSKQRKTRRNSEQMAGGAREKVVVTGDDMMHIIQKSPAFLKRMEQEGKKLLMMEAELKQRRSSARKKPSRPSAQALRRSRSD